MPLQGFLNAIVYAWTKDEFLQAMGISSVNNQDEVDDDQVNESTAGNTEDLEDSITRSRTTPTDNFSIHNRQHPHR